MYAARVSLFVLFSTSGNGHRVTICRRPGRRPGSHSCVFFFFSFVSLVEMSLFTSIFVPLLPFCLRVESTIKYYYYYYYITVARFFLPDSVFLSFVTTD